MLFVNAAILIFTSMVHDLNNQHLEKEENQFVLIGEIRVSGHRELLVKQSEAISCLTLQALFSKPFFNQSKSSFLQSLFLPVKK